MQALPGGHVLPHAPQLSGLLLVSVQTPPQRAAHAVHTPLVHVCVARHALPQAPQLRGSLLVSVQAPAQTVAHGTQAPPVQTWSA